MIRLCFFFALAGSFVLTALAPQVCRPYVVISAFVLIGGAVLVAEHYTRKTITKQAYEEGADEGYEAAWEDVRSIIGGASGLPPVKGPLSVPGEDPPVRRADQR